jgi:hypothetical protein
LGDSTRESGRAPPELEHPSSTINIRPLGPTFGGSGSREFRDTLALEISTANPVQFLYYTLNGSDPSPENHDGAGYEHFCTHYLFFCAQFLRSNSSVFLERCHRTPPIQVDLSQSATIKVRYLGLDGFHSAMRSETFIMYVFSRKATLSRKACSRIYASRSSTGPD